MSRDTQTELRLVYSHLQGLKSLKENHVPERQGREYNDLVRRLMALGYDASEFLIAENDLSYIVEYGIRSRQKVTKRQHTVRYGVFHRKLNSLLLFLELTNDARIVSITLPRSG